MKRRGATRFGRLATWVVVALILAFILSPLVAVVIDSFNSVAYNVFPPIGFSLKWYGEAIFSSRFAGPILNSLLIALAATALSIAVGLPVALALVRNNFRGKSLLNVFFLAPLIFPTFIFGLGSLIYFFELRIFGSFESVLVAHLIIVSPYVVRVLSSSLVGFDRSLEDAASSLGANKLSVFSRITIPVIMPGIVAASLFSFIISFDEVGATIFLLRPGGFQTLPVAMFNYVTIYNDPSIAAISVLLMLLAVVVVVIIGRFTKTSFLGKMV